MELTYFYKAEMPNYQDWTLDVSKLNILLISNGYGTMVEQFHQLY